MSMINNVKIQTSVSRSARILFYSLIVIFAWGYHTVVVHAQSSEVYMIPRLNGPIILDGKVDEPAWDAIEPVPLVTHWPNFGQVSDDGTELRIAYDEYNLYVSCRCYGDPQRISAPTNKRNGIGLHMDHISIVLDTFKDSENALWFTVSPTGSRMDAAVRNDGQGDNPTNTYWDTIWEAESVITDFGWTTEMRIPYSSLRFESRDGHVEMGLIAYRYSAHNVTMQIFPAIPSNWGFWSFLKPSQSHSVAINDIQNRNPVFVTPYLLGGVQRSASINPDAVGYQHDRDLTHEAGLDIKMGLTNNITLDLTLNTDFAQVEADDQQINLTRFSLFFPERRQFFLERAAIFDFSFGEQDRLFYSRRIGLSDGQPLRILGGARMIARSGSWDVGLLSMQTARGLGLSSENHSIVRVRKQVFNPLSYVGSMFTSRIDESGNYNIAYGIDGILNIWGDDFLNINIAQTAASGLNTSAFNHESIRLRTEWQRRSYAGLSYNISYNYSGNLYEPGMGFQLRNNYMRFGDRVSWGWQPGEDSALQRIQLSANGSLYLSNTDRQFETSEYGPSLELTWRRGDFAKAQILYISEDISESFDLSDDAEIPAGYYRFPEAELEYDTPRGRTLRAKLTAGGGGFFDGRRLTVGIQPYWSLSRVVQFDLSYQWDRIVFNDRNQKLTAHIARFRTELTFNTRVTFTSFVQFNSADNLSILNLRLRYNPRDGNNLYLVFNETLNANRDRLVPRLPSSENRTVMVKYDFTF